MKTTGSTGRGLLLSGGFLLLLTLSLAPAPPARAAGDVRPLIALLKAVGAEGAGNAEAAEAFRGLIRSGPDTLLPLLESLDDASPPASQWLRAAVDQIAGEALSGRRPLPVKELEGFARQQRHNPRARFAAALLDQQMRRPCRVTGSGWRKHRHPS
jgi:hypothetical protein